MLLGFTGELLVRLWMEAGAPGAGTTRGPLYLASFMFGLGTRAALLTGVFGVLWSVYGLPWDSGERGLGGGAVEQRNEPDEGH